MANISWKNYARLASKVYPNQFAITQKRGRSPLVWIDTEHSWSKLDPFIKKMVIEGLERMERSGKRDADDTLRDNRVIKEKL